MADTLTYNFWPPALWENKVVLFEATQFVTLCYSSSRKLIQFDSCFHSCVSNEWNTIHSMVSNGVQMGPMNGHRFCRLVLLCFVFDVEIRGCELTEFENNCFVFALQLSSSCAHSGWTISWASFLPVVRPSPFKYLSQFLL